MIPVIALVGCPNVGKSTLFNRLTRSRDALVANFPGLTRDRKYGEGEWEGRRFVVIDTGGITGDEEGIDGVMAAQSLQAIEEADEVLFMVDSRAGLSSGDLALGDYLRQTGRKVWLVANKVDGMNPDVAMAECYELGFENVFPITATHGRGVRQMMEMVLADYAAEPEPEPDLDKLERGIRIAVVGRPNVGKSTLVNRMLGEERVVVFDEPGTTRDSIYIDYERNGRRYTLIDTAGIRRRKNIKLVVEKFSIVKTLQAIDDANVAILLIDAREGLVDQDLHMMSHVLESGRALVLAVNKWDGLESDEKERIKYELERRLRFVEFADVHFISALHGTGVGHLYESIERAYRAATDPLSTSRLTRILNDAVQEHQPPLVHGRRIKLRYAHAGGRNPPLIIIHGNQTDAVPGHYTRFLEKVFRRELDLHGTPVRIEYRGGENPFSGQKNVLTARQIAKKKRLMQHVRRKK